MTSELQRAANRHNAKKSSGPKTVLGKTRASANSRKHGLAAKRVYDAAEQEEIATLVDRILTTTGKLISLSQAISIAVAQLDLQKVSSIETAYLETMYGVNLAGPNPISRAKALHGLVATRRYALRCQGRRDRVLRDASRAIAQNEPNFEIVNHASRES
jgi:hypothetical protein